MLYPWLTCVTPKMLTLAFSGQCFGPRYRDGGRKGGLGKIRADHELARDGWVCERSSAGVMSYQQNGLLHVFGVMAL